jgi:oxygen-dependent protoporphyrinogen oxidase
METRYGSLTRGMLAAHKEMRAKMAAMRAANGNGAGGTQGQGAPREGSGKGSGARSIFTTLKGGLQQLIDALEGRLNPQWIRKSTSVDGLERDRDGWRLRTGERDELYDAVILASPAWAAGKLLAATDAALADELSAIPYSSSITVNLVFDESQLGPLPDGFGFLVPAVEGRAMLACTFVHRKFVGRTPAGKAVLRAFLGGAKNEALLDQSDEVLVATVRRELSEILGARIVGPHIPTEATQVSRWRRAMAQYAVGHQERMKRVKEHVSMVPGLRLAGNAYDGIGIPDCIRTGRHAAKELVAEKQSVSAGR